MITERDIWKLFRKNIKDLQPYSSARDEYKSTTNDMVYLDANESPFDTGVNRYPDPQQRDLKEVLGNIKGVGTENILIGNGSDEVLDLLFRIFCEPKTDNVLTLPPTYGMYKVLAGVNDVENREIPLLPSLEPNVDEILSKTDSNSKILFICSPNNPTGNLFPADKIRDLIEQFPGIVVIDEAYIDFAANESWIRELGSFPNLVVTQTLSKAYGLAGIRLGTCYAGKEIIQALNKIKPPYNVNSLTQEMALERLEEPEIIKEEISSILEQKAWLQKKLTDIGFIDSLFPSDANFILSRVDNAPLRYKQLIEKGIVVRDRSSQLHCENTLRFTVGTGEENKQLINALRQLDNG